MNNIEYESRKPLDIKDIKKGVFIKRYTNIYLVKDFKEDVSNKYKGKYRIEYFFRISTKTSNPQLHSGRYDIADSSDFYFKRIKQPTNGEIEKLKEKIKQKCSRFDFNTLSYMQSNNTEEFTIEKCIDFLKKRGYVVLKQM